MKYVTLWFEKALCGRKFSLLLEEQKLFFVMKGQQGDATLLAGQILFHKQTKLELELALALELKLQNLIQQAKLEQLLILIK